MSHYLKPSQEETNLVFAIKNLTISTEGYVHFLLMQNIKKFNDLNPGTGFDIEHVFFSHCVTHSQGFQGRQKIHKSILHLKLLSSCAKIEPKLNKLQKTIEIVKKIVKNPCCLTVFRILFHLSSILAKGELRKCMRAHTLAVARVRVLCLAF